jgi:3-phosphoshikimate 1-carboxyvinyltransferase
MILKINPGSELSGTLGETNPCNIPGDKSISHRAAILPIFGDGVSTIDNFLVSGVTEPVLEAIEKFGLKYELEGNRLKIFGQGLETGRQVHRKSISIDCGHSATSMRLLAGTCAALRKDVILDGSPGLRSRPMQRIIDPLERMGVTVSSTNGYAPLRINSRDHPLNSIVYQTKVASAQVKSCILLAGLDSRGEVEVLEPGPSRDHTERMLRKMGIELEIGKEVTRISRYSGTEQEFKQIRMIPSSSGILKPLDLKIPGDFSAAAFVIVAGLITPGSSIRIQAVGLNPSRTGLLDVLRSMEARVEVEDYCSDGAEPYGDLIIRTSDLKGIEVDGSLVVRMIDEFPVFAVAACFARGETIVREATELRFKESDRISSLCSELKKLGADIQETDDGFIIQGGSDLQGGTVNPHSDHRLAMSMAVAGLASREPVLISEPDIIQQSFPQFVEILNYLGSDAEIIPVE